MRTYATAQNIGGRSHQCDATAVHSAPDGSRAYVLLDGIGSSEEVREWTRTAARRLARAASRRGSAEDGLRHIYNGYAAEKDRQAPYLGRYMPKAAAVVALTVPGSRLLDIAWCGDSRAYLLRAGNARRLTQDHNLRRVYPPTTLHGGGNRNRITSCLGAIEMDEEVKSHYGHPAIEAFTMLLDPGDRLVLASDGAYEPHADADHDLDLELCDNKASLTAQAREFVDRAVTASRTLLPPEDHCFVDNATVMIADLA